MLKYIFSSKIKIFRVFLPIKIVFYLKKNGTQEEAIYVNIQYLKKLVHLTEFRLSGTKLGILCCQFIMV